MLIKAFIFPVLIILLTLVVGCGSMDPRNVDVELKENTPVPRVTSFDRMLSDLGRMSTLYGNSIRIQSESIADNTGSSLDTKSGIPKDITEMTKSALNAIGGGVAYIPYNPSYVNNSMLTGYSAFEGKLLPDVILSGGITEYDQNIVVRSKGLDLSVTSAPFNVNESFVPGDTLELGYNDSDKSELARITLDYNLVDFKTLTGIAKVQTSNTIVVEKVVKEKELSFSLFGPTFGMNGSVTKEQGKHAAIRLLVQLSVMQMVGKYLMLPYWKLLPNAQPDQHVLERVRENHRAMTREDKIRVAQISLFFLGHDIEITGQLDTPTIQALQQYSPAFDPSSNTIDSGLHLRLWEAMADDLDKSLDRQTLLSSNIAENQAAEPQDIAPVQEAAPQPAVEQAAEPPQRPPPSNAVKKPATAPAKKKATAPSPEEQQALREKTSQDAMFRLLKKLSIWDEQR